MFFLLIYLTSSGGHLDEYDGVVFFALTEGMIMHHSIKLPIDAPVYAKTGLDIKYRILLQRAFYEPSISPNQPIQPIYIGEGLLLSTIAIPLYLMGVGLSIDPIHFVPYFLNSIILSITALMVFLTSKEFFSSNRISFILSIIFTVTSFVWPYINSMWQQPLISLLLISSFYFLLLSKRTNKLSYVILAAVFLGLSIHAHPEAAVLIPVFFIYSMYQYRSHSKLLLTFPIALAPPIILQAYLNYIRFGSILDFGYGWAGYLSFHQSLKGVLGLVMSPGYGIVFFFPLFLLVPLSIFLFYKNYSKSIAITIITIFIVSCLYFGTEDWSNGAWGPRHLIPVMPFIVLSLGAFIKKYSKKISAKIIFIILATIGFIVNTLGVLVWWMYSYAYGWEVEALWQFKNNSEIFTWDPYHSLILQSIKVLSSNYLLHINNHHPIDYRNIGWAPCRYDDLLYCNFGLWSIVLSATGIVLLSFFIFKKIRIEDRKLSM